MGRREKKNNETGDKAEDGKFSVLPCRMQLLFWEKRYYVDNRCL